MKATSAAEREPASRTRGSSSSGAPSGVARTGSSPIVARTTEHRSGELRRLELERYDDLLDLDFASAGTPVEHPLFLVCTHGKHDRCCAKFGRPLYEAVREQVEEDWVWQSTHVGGDRFAGNLVSLPDGVYYGRVEPARGVARARGGAAPGRVHLPQLPRPLVSFASPAQAAERAVREATGLLGVDDTSVISVERDRGEGWHAEVAARGAVYAVEVRREEGAPTHLTCSTEQLRRPKRHDADSRRRKPSRTSLLTSTRRPASSSEPGSSPGAEGALASSTRNSARRRAAPGSASSRPSNASVAPSRSAITVSRRTSSVSRSS